MDWKPNGVSNTEDTSNVITENKKDTATSVTEIKETEEFASDS